MRTSRVEAFSDGVFAIAVTLLVLDLRVPQDHAHDLGHALWNLWPNYAAYIVSFVVIGIIWINHHTVMNALARVDQMVLVLNLLLLMFVAAIPFTTSLVAEYLREGHAAKLSVAVYSAVMLAQAVVWLILWPYAVHHEELLAAGVDPVRARASVRRFAVGVPIYAVAVALSFANAYLVLFLHLVVALLYLRGRIDLGEGVTAQ